MKKRKFDHYLLLALLWFSLSLLAMAMNDSLLFLSDLLLALTFVRIHSLVNRKMTICINGEVIEFSDVEELERKIKKILERGCGEF